MNRVINQLAKDCQKLGYSVHPSNIVFDDSRSWSLYVLGSLIGVTANKFGAYRDYYGGDVRGPVMHNGRMQDGTLELGCLFESALLEIEALINEDYEDADPWELPTGVLM